MKLFIKPNPINNNIEKYIIDTIKKQKNTINFFTHIDDKLCADLIEYIKINYKTNITCILINSIKSSYVKQNIIQNNIKININAKYIKNLYLENEKFFNKGDTYNNPILISSEKFNLSPLNIMRFIIKEKYSKKLTKIDKKKISKFDLLMLNFSIEHDEYAIINGNIIMKEADEFEKDIEKLLIKLNIKYKTQNDLVKEQTEKYGKSINTPDFLILSDLYINGIKINWIDAKKFYGSCVKFVKEKIIAQTNKYITEYGTGSIIFSLSFNSDLKYENILLLDYNSFEKNI
jgi:hypothetical protein